MTHTTCWTVIRGAAEGRDDDRAAFVRRYESVVRAYLGARWAGTPRMQEIDDAVQEVFVEAFRSGGVLERVRPDASGGFRPFFYGVIRNVARRAEDKGARRREHPAAMDDAGVPPAADDTRLSQLFDRHWARAIMREAAARHAERAADQGADALERVELLRLRFHDGLPIRDIATRLDRDPVQVHRDYARARREFREALLEVVAFNLPGSPDEIHRECGHLLAMLG